VEVDAAVLGEAMPQATRLLRPGKAGAPPFDRSGDPTAARRNARKGPLTRAGKPRARISWALTAALSVGLLAASGALVWVATDRNPEKKNYFFSGSRCPGR